MIMCLKKFIPALIAHIVILLMVSCPSPHGSEDTPYVPPTVTKQFLAYDFTQNTNYQIDAVCLAEGQKCIVWAEKSVNISVDTGKAIADEYDTNIYPKIVGTFGSDSIMSFGDIDGDGKFTLLLLDIKDGFTGSGAYTAGYFDWRDLLEVLNSNRADMIYVDAYPSIPGSSQSYATIAHELQHFINFMTSQEKRSSLMDTWIDEGLSAAAEYVYLERHDTDRVEWFTSSETIPQGNNFFIWGENPDNILDEYSTAYLFFQWLRLQSGGTGIYRAIIESTYYDYRAVTQAINGTFDAELGTVTWENLLRAWFAANYINSPDGIYGYKGELPTVRVRAIGGSTKALLPGEGVYSTITSSFSPGSSGPHIKYAGLSAGDTLVTTSPSYTGERLLTFNALGDYIPHAEAQNFKYWDDLREPGTLTNGVDETIPSASIVGNGRQVWRQPGSWAIDARDLLGRRGREEAGLLKRWGPGNGED